jgi:FKBP-type peptidyl-prolyl cis-trans isomerase 2
MVFHLKWKSDGVVHTDGYQASRINIWRDFIPPILLEEMMGKQAGERIEVHLKPDDFLPDFRKQDLFQINSNQFGNHFTMDTLSDPAIGRFYPRGMLKSVTGVFSANVLPFRLIQINNGHMTVNFNHSLAGKDLVLTGIVGKVEQKESERGGQQCRLDRGVDNRSRHARQMAAPANRFLFQRRIYKGR